MLRSAGFVLAAGGVALVNEVVFAPLAGNGSPLQDINWRLVPATGVMALVLGGFEKLAPGFAVGLSGLVLLSVLILRIGNAPSPIENIDKVLFSNTSKVLGG